MQVTGWQYCDGATVSCLSDSNQPAAVGDNLDLALTVKSEAEDPEEVDDAKRAETGKDPICVDPDDPNEEDDDCPVVYDMGGNSEMVLNKGVSALLFKPGKVFPYVRCKLLDWSKLNEKYLYYLRKAISKQLPRLCSGLRFKC